MPEPLIVTHLKEPKLRFDYDNRQAVNRNAFQGLREFGPYDSDARRRRGISATRVVIVGRKDQRNALARVSEALKTQRLGKLHDVFVLEFVDEILVSAARANDEAEAYRRAIEDWYAATPYKRDIELAVVLHGGELEYSHDTPYYSSKAAFLRRGVPTQSIRYDKVSPDKIDNFRNYNVANILTACYAKVGGTPWVVATDGDRPEVTIGVATTEVRRASGAKRYVGVSAIFRENGAFVLWDITALQANWEAYEEHLQTSITRAIASYEEREKRKVKRVACHVSGKRAGRRETRAIESALHGRSISADLVHVTDDAPLLLMDGAHSSLLPQSGLLTHLSIDATDALMHTEGRGGTAQLRPRPLRLGLHSPVPPTGCLSVYQHLYDLRWMSWRGVRAAGGPVSVGYPHKMARLLGYLHEQEDVEALEILPSLKEKAWFL